MNSSSNVRQTRARRAPEHTQSFSAPRRNMTSIGRVVSVDGRILRPRTKARYGPYIRAPEYYAERPEPPPAEDPILPCTICLNEMHPKSGLPTSSLACGHVFCTPCIKKWIRKKSVCPTCIQTVRQYDIRPLYLSF